MRINNAQFGLDPNEKIEENLKSSDITVRADAEAQKVILEKLNSANPLLQREAESAIKLRSKKIQAAKDTAFNKEQEAFQKHVLAVAIKTIKGGALNDEEKAIATQLTKKNGATTSEILKSALEAKYEIIDDYTDRVDYGPNDIRGATQTITHERRKFDCLSETNAHTLFEVAIKNSNLEAVNILINTKRWSVEDQQEESLLSQTDIKKGNHALNPNTSRAATTTEKTSSNTKQIEALKKRIEITLPSMEQDLQKKLNDQAILSSIEEAIKKAELKKVSEALKKYGRTTSGLIGIFQSRESQTLQSELKKIEKSTDSTDQKHAKMLTAINTAFATDKYITKKSALKDALNKAINIHELKKEFPCFEEDAARVPSL